MAPPDDTPVEIKPTAVTVSAPVGAVHSPLYARRTVKTYPIQEHELDALGDLNKNATIWYAIFSSAVVLLIGAIWDMVSAGSATANQLGLSVLFLAIAIVAWVLARSYEKTRSDRLTKIKEECDLDG